MSKTKNITLIIKRTVKKIIILFFVIMFGVLLFFVPISTPYKFLHDVTEINSIEIVEIGDYDSNNKLFPMETIYYVRDVELFLSRFKEIPCYRVIGGDPQGIEAKDIAIKFDFNNGDYELIHDRSQAIYTSNSGFQNYVSLYWFDSEDYEEFISMYLLDDN